MVKYQLGSDYMTTVNLLDEMSVYENAFTKSEVVLFDYLKINIDEIIYMSVTELAEKSKLPNWAFRSSSINACNSG